MEKSIIPFIFVDPRLCSIVNEINENLKLFDNFTLKNFSLNDIKSTGSDILITDNQFYSNNSNLKSYFQKILIINTDLEDLKISETGLEISIINLPFKFSDIIKRISGIIFQTKSQKSKQLKFKKFIYDPIQRTLFNNVSSMVFTEKESQIFRCLLENFNSHVPKKNLLKNVWSYNEDIDTHTLETHIYSLRKKIEKKLLLKGLIIFEEKKGYLLDKSVL